MHAANENGPWGAQLKHIGCCCEVCPSEQSLSGETDETEVITWKLLRNTDRSLTPDEWDLNT